MKRKNEVPIPEPLRVSLREITPEKRRVYERIWSILPDHAPAAPPVDEAWDDLKRRLDSNLSPAGRADRRPRRARLYGFAIAAALIVLFIVTGLWVMFRPAVFETAAAEQQTVQLPDGSVVDLNSATRLRVASRFESTLLGSSDRRLVHLDGEAYFTVAENPRPFVVETSDALVQVTGTEFNVRARGGSAESGTLVTLVEGSVVVASRTAEGESVTLDAPGAVASASPGMVTSRRDEATLDHVLAWRRNGFAFIDTPVDVILDEFERRFNVEVRPRGGVERAEPMNLFYSRGVSPEEILNDICVAQACAYRETSRGYALTEPPSSNIP